MKKTLLTIALATVLTSVSAYADEGMWMVNAINRALEANMKARGLKLAANEIYNADAEGAGISDAIVSLDFSCSGSVISDNGLIITNHHCAYSDVFALSTVEHNYLEDGYWAFYQKDEVPIPYKGVQFLKKVLDVTDEANAVLEEYKEKNLAIGSRKLSSIIEKRYQDETGLEASLYTMWSGSRYYLALYVNYSDVRLVAAPPVSIAAFGGDIDNWEWPQHKGDFAMYRIYTAPDGSPAKYSEENIPLKPVRKLEISTEGYKEGDFAMVIGYPGVTSRYNSAAKTASIIDVTMPISTRIRGSEMEIIKRWMDSDPGIRLKYSDWFFGLSNIQEMNEDEIECCHRFGVIDEKRELEMELQEWIAADPARFERWGGVIQALEEKWSAAKDALIQETFARESLIRSSRLAVFCLRLQSKASNAKSSMAEEYGTLDMRVEKDVFNCAMREFLTNVDRKSWSDFHRKVWDTFDGDLDRIGEYIWNNSIFSSQEKVDSFIAGNDSIAGDPIYEFFTSVKMSSFVNATKDAEGTPTRLDLGRAYTQALYEMREDKGIPQYPDANSSMRISYGTVRGFEPYDAVLCDWKSTTAGILEKYNPDDYDFSLKPEWKAVVGSYAGPVNFLTDCDITGGNSGSPVMNDRGQLIGLAFDGNREGLASDVSYTPGYNMCVCVDIRYVLFILKEYAKFDRILDEIGF